MLVYVGDSVHYGYHSVAQIIAIPSTAYTLHVDKLLRQLLLLVSRERHVVVIL